jgi:ADP-ribose pyrophosphatase YjhB (NUDIX family)
MNKEMDIFTFLEEVRIIARNGLVYSRDSYDRDRYERLLGLASWAYSQELGLPSEEVRERFMQELGHITLKVGADAAIFNAQGEILLMERNDGTGWCLPCGFVEPDESPAQAAVREALEETGLEIEVRALVGVFTRKASANNGPHALLAVVHLCEVTGGTLTLSKEGLDLRYWPLDDVPQWHATHETYARAAHAMWQAQGNIPAVSV